MIFLNIFRTFSVIKYTWWRGWKGKNFVRNYKLQFKVTAPSNVISVSVVQHKNVPCAVVSLQQYTPRHSFIVELSFFHSVLYVCTYEIYMCVYILFILCYTCMHVFKFKPANNALPLVSKLHHSGNELFRIASFATISDNQHTLSFATTVNSLYASGYTFTLWSPYSEMTRSEHNQSSISKPLPFPVTIVCASCWCYA